MKASLGTCLVFCFAIFSLGSALRCYRCTNYSGRCTNVQECSYEDACLQLFERGGKIIRQCIRNTDCEQARLSQMFPAVSHFTHSCCNSNLCNGGPATITKPLLGTLASLVVFWWCLL